MSLALEKIFFCFSLKRPGKVKGSQRRWLVVVEEFLVGELPLLAGEGDGGLEALAGPGEEGFGGLVLLLAEDEGHLIPDLVLGEGGAVAVHDETAGGGDGEGGGAGVLDGGDGGGGAIDRVPSRRGGAAVADRAVSCAARRAGKRRRGRRGRKRFIGGTGVEGGGLKIRGPRRILKLGT